MKKYGIWWSVLLVLWLAACSNPFISIKEIGSDIGGIGIDVGGSERTYIVTYFWDGKEYTKQGYPEGNVVSFPDDPTKEGYVFAGWFKDESFKTDSRVYNSSPISSDLNLYAKMVPADETYYVEFIKENVSFGTKEGKIGDKIELPPEQSAPSGMIWSGWYLTDAPAQGNPAISGSYYTISAEHAENNVIKIYAVFIYADEEKPVSEITLSPSRVESLKVGATQRLAVTFFPADANTGKSVEWRSSDPRIATVDSNGVVTGVQEGSVTITADNGKGVAGTSDIAVTVSSFAYTLSLDQTEVKKNLGEDGNTFKIIATVSPAGTPLLWSSDNTDVASVSQDGAVVIRKAGNATITVKVNVESINIAQICRVAVIDASTVPKSIKPLVSPSSLRVGGTAALSAIVTYSDGTFKSVESGVSFASGNEACASVSGNTLKALKAGNGTVSATYTENGTTVSSSAGEAAAFTVLEAINGYRVHLTNCAWADMRIYYYNKTNPNAAGNDNEVSAWAAMPFMIKEADGWYYDLSEPWVKGGKTMTIFYSSDANRYPADLKPGEVVPAGVNEAWFDLATKQWATSGSAGSEGPEISVKYSDGVLTIASSEAISDAMVSVSGGYGSKSLTASDFSGKSAVVDVSSWGLVEGNSISVAGYAASASGATVISQTVTVSSFSGVCIFVQSVSAPNIWMWEADGLAISQDRGDTWPGVSMTAAASSDMNDASGWYKMLVEESELSGKNISMQIGGNNAKTYVFKTANPRGWLSAGASEFVYSDPTKRAEPVEPTAAITPSSGEIALNRSIVISVTDGNSDITSIEVKAGSKTYSKQNFAGTTLSIPVKELGVSEGARIEVSVTVKTVAYPAPAAPAAKASLTVAEEAAEDAFTWDNALVYFVLTDRFYNGISGNDYSYYRKNDKNSSIPDVATFHGGDIAGLTQKLDYLENLGVNAVWITAPYEQIHGWCSGKDNAFPHYAFHGYYTQDWTYMDQNMGTIEEFRTFVTEAHKRGIRVVMDVVMNHTGYNTVEDMYTYDFGGLSSGVGHGWTDTGGNWGKNHDVTNYGSVGKWINWWSNWVRAFGDQPWGEGAGFGASGSGDLLLSLSGLPDVMTEKTGSVGIPVFLKTKWKDEPDGTTVPASTGNTLGHKYGDYKLPTVSGVDWYGKSGDWRTDNKGAPADYIVIWLSAWVREFGIDGFRCDTAKHVDMYRWGQLKDACEDALKKWRADSSKADDSGAKGWNESFWMTGEHFGWGQSVTGDYFTIGKFDSMINFSFNGSQWSGSGSSGRTPAESDWNSYAAMIAGAADGDGNGNRNSVLSYVSSHDTGLHRPSDIKALGTMLVLLPGGVQIYYGDESARPAYADSKGDTDMATRGDMNFGSNADSVAHWGKVGTFRKYNPAVGAGSQSVSGSTYKRTYSGAAGESKVAIVLNGSSADVGGLFADGTTVYNWYDGTSVKVSGGMAAFSKSASVSAPILVSDRNPADFGISF